jgi:hypothetical protein
MGVYVEVSPQLTGIEGSPARDATAMRRRRLLLLSRGFTESG